MQYRLLKDGIVVGEIATLDPQYQPPEGFALGPWEGGGLGLVWNGRDYGSPSLEQAGCAHLPGAFTPEECAQLLGKGSALGSERGTVRRDGARHYRPEQRRSTVGWLRLGDPETEWVFEKIWALARRENTRFGLSLERLTELQFTRYDSAEGGHFAWHADSGFVEAGNWERKLSFVLMLSAATDYQGGQFEIESVGAVPLGQGDVIMFPSPCLHRVTPVTGGVRHSLVAWLQGQADQ